ncbi:MAG: hypothetical protein K0S05_3324 [Agromyces sp.]|nr:hypothetical protein [Agromyces sp.]
MGQADQLGCSGRAGGAREHREFRVQVVPGALAALREHPAPLAATEDDVGVVPLEQRTTVRLLGGIAVDEEHRVSAFPCGQVRHERFDVVRAGDHDEAADLAQLLPPLAHARGEVAVAEASVGGEHRGRSGVEPAQVQRTRDGDLAHGS